MVLAEPFLQNRLSGRARARQPNAVILVLLSACVDTRVVVSLFEGGSVPASFLASVFAKPAPC